MNGDVNTIYCNLEPQAEGFYPIKNKLNYIELKVFNCNEIVLRRHCCKINRSVKPHQLMFVKWLQEILMLSRCRCYFNVLSSRTYVRMYTDRH